MIKHPTLAAALEDHTVPEPVLAHDFLAKAFPPRGVILSPWLPEKGLAMIAGPRGLGKTHLALGVAHTVACGGEMLGWRAERSRRTLYIDGEMPAVDLQARLKHIVQRASGGIPSGALAFLSADDCQFGLPDLSSLEGQEALLPRLEPFELIIFDNLSTLCRSGKENDAESWALVQSFALRLRWAGKSVLFIHHTGKGGAQRGTSKREDVLDSVLLLRPPEDGDTARGARFVVEFSKHRNFFGADAAPFEAALDPETGQWRATALTSDDEERILRLSSEGVPIREIAARLGMSKSKVGRIVRDAADADELNAD